MICFECGADTKVVDSRPSPDGKEIMRKRECLVCPWRAITYEAFHATIKPRRPSRGPIVRKVTTNELPKAAIKKRMEQRITRRAGLYVSREVFNDMDAQGLLNWKCKGENPQYQGQYVYKE